jgi:hypothetical protein
MRVNLHYLTLLGQARLSLSRVTHERPGLRKGRVMRGVASKLRFQIDLVGRRFLGAGKFPYKRRDVSLDCYSIVGLTRILLPTSRARAATQKLPQTPQAPERRIDQSTRLTNPRHRSLRLPKGFLTCCCLFCARSRYPLRLSAKHDSKTKLTVDGYVSILVRSCQRFSVVLNAIAVVNPENRDRWYRLVFGTLPEPEIASVAFDLFRCNFCRGRASLCMEIKGSNDTASLRRSQ